MTWRPDLTVAAIVQRDGRFLIVEERIQQATVFNQPAGHVEDRESPVDAVIRETLEETAWHFVPRQLLGIYLWRNDANARTTVRIAISGDVSHHDPNRRLDHGIIRAHWLRREELVAQGVQLRSPLVLQCVDDFLSGRHHDLDVLQQVGMTPAIRIA
jgi:8-oxo-dGTP pyrophosphatase MutT (NUDIX family)